MKKLDVAYTFETDPDKILDLLEHADRHRLDYTLWKRPAHTPQAAFSMRYNRNFIYLKYFVSETTLLASVQKTNGAVWEDNCVEFFISLDERMSYFNFEFNSIGTRLAAFGTSKTKRKALPVAVVESIKTLPKVIRSVPGLFEWELFVIIPVRVFQQPVGFSLENRQCHGNFYKCGDGLRDPHFLSWSEIKSEEQNFHLPKYFGEIFFHS